MKNTIIGVNKDAAKVFSLGQFIKMHKHLSKDVDLEKAYYDAFPGRKPKPIEASPKKSDSISE